MPGQPPQCRMTHRPETTKFSRPGKTFKGKATERGTLWCRRHAVLLC